MAARAAAGVLRRGCAGGRSDGGAARRAGRARRGAAGRPRRRLRRCRTGADREAAAGAAAEPGSARPARRHRRRRSFGAHPDSVRGLAMKPWLWLALLAFVSPAHAFDGPRLTAAARAEEAALDARLGAAALDTATGEVWGYRADERFPLDSTHKAFACAALLAKA